ncbi:ABC transporter permease [Tsuneonella sp. HG222]
MSDPAPKARLSMLAAALVIARRDFLAVIRSRTFFFFLLGPLFPIIVGLLAGGVGSQLAESTGVPRIGVAMEAGQGLAMITARDSLVSLGHLDLPEMVEVAVPAPGETYDAVAGLDSPDRNIAAVLTGTIERPLLTGPAERLDHWRGDVGLIAATAQGKGPQTFPNVAMQPRQTSNADTTRALLRTAQAGQTLLFLLIMLLAGMVLSNLVEEKANKIIEILAAAIPMDAVFMGKLFAMLAVSLVGISVWATVIAGLFGVSEMGGLMGGMFDPAGLPEPGVGWPLFILFGVSYFAMGYLLLGTMFLAIGSLATTVRDVQTLSMPVTMGQVLLFFFASYAMAHSGEPVEWAAMAFPLSSPFAMLARAAQSPQVWPHLVALAWQALWVAIAIRVGARLFRKRVMKSGPQKVRRRLGLAALVAALFRNGSRTTP